MEKGLLLKLPGSGLKYPRFLVASGALCWLTGTFQPQHLPLFPFCPWPSTAKLIPPSYFPSSLWQEERNFDTALFPVIFCSSSSDLGSLITRQLILIPPRAAFVLPDTSGIVLLPHHSLHGGTFENHFPRPLFSLNV